MLELFQILDGIPAVDLTSCGGLGPVIKFIKFGIMPIIQFGIPIMLILFGSLDLGKAVMSQDDKEIKGATGKLIKRAIAAAIVFFIPWIVNLVMSLISTSGIEGTGAWATCWSETQK